MNVDSDVGLGRDLRLAGVEADADADIGVRRPWLGREGSLRGGGGGDGSGRGRERDEERVALGPELLPALGSEGGPHQLLVARQYRRPTVAEVLEETGRPLDVAEQERDGTGEQLRHRVGSVRCREASGQAHRTTAL